LLVQGSTGCAATQHLWQAHKHAGRHGNVVWLTLLPGKGCLVCTQQPQPGKPVCARACVRARVCCVCECVQKCARKCMSVCLYTFLCTHTYATGGPYATVYHGSIESSRTPIQVKTALLLHLCCTSKTKIGILALKYCSPHTPQQLTGLRPAFLDQRCPGFLPARGQGDVCVCVCVCVCVSGMSVLRQALPQHHYATTQTAHSYLESLSCN